jgi:C1A family cysteine protease
MEFWEKEESGAETELSPRFLYYHAQKIDGISGKHEGTHLLAACKVAQKLGTCKESLLPYIPKEEVEPKPEHYIDALRYRIKLYTRVRTLDQLKQAIVDPKVKAVLIGVKVYKQMISDRAKITGIVDNPTCWDRSLGGHALCAGAYRDKSPFYKKDGHIKVKNSWGEKYGAQGYLFLSYSYLKKNLLDAFACIDLYPSDLEKYAFERIGNRKEWIV